MVWPHGESEKKSVFASQRYEKTRIVVLVGKRIRRSCAQVVRERSGKGHVVVRSAAVLGEL